MLTGQAVQLTWQAVQLTWQAVQDVRTGHVAAPGDATCHAVLDFLACNLTNLEVTRVTTGWVTRGTRVTSASCVAG
jgi:hypothetical protein